MTEDISLHEDTAAEPLRPWLPADLLDNAARTISENKTIMLGLPVLAAIALLAVQAALMRWDGTTLATVYQAPPGQSFLATPRCGGSALTVTAFSESGDEQVTAPLG